MSFHLSATDVNKLMIFQGMFHTEKVKNIYFPLLMSPCWLWHVHWLRAFSSSQTGLRSPNPNPQRVSEVNRFTLYCSILQCRLWHQHRRIFISTSIISLIPFMFSFLAQSHYPFSLLPAPHSSLFIPQSTCITYKQSVLITSLMVTFTQEQGKSF